MSVTSQRAYLIHACFDIIITVTDRGHWGHRRNRSSELPSDVRHRVLHVGMILENDGEMISGQRVDVAEGLCPDASDPSPFAHQTDFCHNDQIERQCVDKQNHAIYSQSCHFL